MPVDNIDKLLYKLFNDKFRILHHLIFWLIYFSDFLMQILRAGLDPKIPLSDVHLSPTIVYFLIDSILIYLNLYLLIPIFLVKNRIWWYFIVSFAAILLDITLCTIVGLYNCNCFNEKMSLLIFFDSFVGSARNTIFFMGFAVGLKLFKIWIYNQKKIKTLENENLKTELNYLKSQMNPHFLFNTLNNIYVQTKIDHISASETILKLSDLLRYQLYDCSKEMVKLSAEIDYLSNFLDLERIRKNKLKMDFNITGKVNSLMIHPFLFIPFIENAIKHGTTGRDAFIRIDLSIVENDLRFTVENSVHETIRCLSHGGLGLTNVKRRLELLYPEKHRLTVIDDRKTYKAELFLNLTP